MWRILLKAHFRRGRGAPRLYFVSSAAHNSINRGLSLISKVHLTALRENRDTTRGKDAVVLPNSQPRGGAPRRDEGARGERVAGAGSTVPRSGGRSPATRRPIHRQGPGRSALSHPHQHRRRAAAGMQPGGRTACFPAPSRPAASPNADRTPVPDGRDSLTRNTGRASHQGRLAAASYRQCQCAQAAGLGLDRGSAIAP